MANILATISNGFDQSFRIPAPPLTEKNLPDQTGKVCLITGANSGVGYEVASILYSRNATVYLGCRTAQKAHDAIDRIKSTHPDSRGKLVFLQLDLGDLTTIKASADEFLSKESKLHWLDNNAGVMTPPKGTKTKQGYELQIGTNILGPFLLTKLLLPTLKKTAGASESANTVRVSWAGSMAVDVMSPKDGVVFKNDDQGELAVEDFGGMDKAYGTSKAANYLLAKEFGRRGADGRGDGVLHNSYNPGNLSTGLQVHVGNIPIVGPIIVFIFDYILLYHARMGAYTEIYAGLSQDLTLEKDQGGYIIPWGRKTKWNRPDVVAAVGEGKTSDKLFEWCERRTNAYT